MKRTPRLAAEVHILKFFGSAQEAKTLWVGRKQGLRNVSGAPYLLLLVAGF